MSNTVPFTDVASDFLKLVNIPDNGKLALIDYAATDFLTLRNSLIEYLKAVYPLDYQNFSESDLGMMLIELVAYMGAVMSMKADMLAHENFIRTAKDRDSVRKLFELVGISLKGPTSAQAKATTTYTANIGNASITLEPAGRVVTVTSPEDGELLTYTIYLSYAGILQDLLNVDAEIVLTRLNSIENSNPSQWNLVLLEGSFAVQKGQFAEVDSIKSVSLDSGPVVQNSVQVYVKTPNTALSGVYRQVENLYSASSTDDKIFQVVYNDDYKATVLFGDGTNGVSPPANADYTVTYRIGGGSRGNIPSSYINTTVTGTHSAEGVVTLPVVQGLLATGGADAETVEHAKKYGPLSYRTQDRLVSLEDYNAFLNRFISPAGSTGKGIAVTRKAFSSANVIDLYVLEKASSTQLQKASLTFKSQLLSDINNKKMLTDDIVVVDGLIRTVDLIATIYVDTRFRGVEGTIKASVATAIQNYFLADNIDFGDALRLADLNKTIFEIPEVKFSKIDNITEDIIVEFNEIIQLNNLVINVSFV